MTPAAAPRRFPYMKWAQTESFVSPFSLAQSGMPAADPAWLGPPAPADLAPPPAGAEQDLRARLGELFGVPPERVLLTMGASGAMHLLAQHYFRSRPRVVTEVPSYEPFRALGELHGAETVTVHRRVEDDFRLDPGRLEAALAGASPGHVFVSNPHNPTGCTAGAEEVLAGAQAAERAGGVLISNEVYMEFAHVDERVHAFALAPNTWSIGTLTKAYGLGALRVGWIIAGEGVAHEIAALEDLHFLDCVSLPTPSLRLGLAALDHLPALLEPLRRFERDCRPHLVRWLAEEERVRAPAPHLGLTAFPRLAGIDDTHDFARYLARELQVDAVPGEFFGCPGHLRVGFGVPEETLVEGLRRLSQALASYSPSR